MCSPSHVATSEEVEALYLLAGGGSVPDGALSRRLLEKGFTHIVGERCAITDCGRSVLNDACEKAISHAWDTFESTYDEWLKRKKDTRR